MFLKAFCTFMFMMTPPCKMLGYTLAMELHHILRPNLRHTWYDISSTSVLKRLWFWQTHLALTPGMHFHRIGFLPEETFFFRDTRKKVEENYFFQFCPDKTGRNWTKPEKITFGLFLPVLSGQNWKKLDDNWGNFRICQKCWKKTNSYTYFLTKGYGY